MIQNINMPSLAETKRKAIIAKLERRIKNKGFSENLGQKELEQFKDWLHKKKVGYLVMNHESDMLDTAIQRLEL